MTALLPIVLAVVPAALQSTTPATTPDEADYWTVDYLPTPEGELLEVGGMDFDSSGALVASTRRGQVWKIEGALDDDLVRARVTLIAEGLHEGLGLDVRALQGYDKLLVLQRGELSELSDTDADGLIDEIATVCNGWGMSGNYHEFAFGLPRAKDGSYFIGLNVGFFESDWWLGQSVVPYRGWVVRIGPDEELVPYACGFRSPCGLGLDAHDNLFVTDNQGDWMAASPVFHVEPGRFYGHPSSLAWTAEYQRTATLPSKTEPPDVERAPAALWLPYDWSRSPGNMAFDYSAGRFGPFDGQMFIAELTNGMIVRASLEEVRGVKQGACFLFRQGVGSAARVTFAPDGSLFVGMTNRGWGGLSPGAGIARIRWSGRTPLEMTHVTVANDGFDIALTQALEVGATLAAEQFALREYDYDYWWEYGSPERASRRLVVERVEASADRRSVRVFTEPLVAGKVVRGKVPALRSSEGETLLHDEFAYTINQLPDGPFNLEHVVKVVPPPPARDSLEEGWLRLTYGDAFDAWESSGWELCNAELDRSDPTRFEITEGNAALVNVAPDASAFRSKADVGDCEIELSFILPEDGVAHVALMGRYAIELRGRADDALTVDSCGALPPEAEWAGRAPDWGTFNLPGAWQELHAVFRAPHFEEGELVRPARFELVEIDGIVLHENVELGGSTPLAGPAPLVLQVLAGQVAFGGVRVKPLESGEPGAEEGWVPLFPDEELDGWATIGDADWEFDGDVLVGSGAAGALVSPRADYTDFELRGRVKISDGGNSGLFLRARPGDAGIEGYEAEINCSYPDADRTASLMGLAPVRVQLVAPSTWFDYHLTCRNEAEGTRLSVRVNGLLVNDFLDRERRHAHGAVILEQHHKGSTVEFEDLRIRPR